MAIKRVGKVNENSEKKMDFEDCSFMETDGVPKDDFTMMKESFHSKSSGIK